jgi:hypothetical protein
MKKTLFVITGAVVWILGMASLYYWGHKPFDLPQAAAIGRLMLDFLLTGAAITLAGGLGRFLLRIGKKREPSDRTQAADGGEMAVLQAAAGLGVLSLLWLLLGATGLYYRLAAWLALIGGWALLRKDCLAWLKDMAALGVYWKEGRTLDRVVIGFMLLLIALQVIWAAAPSVKYDALTYHLELPRQYILAHNLVFTPDNLFWGHPQLGEMLFTWMMLLHRAETAALLGAGWGVLMLLGVVALTRQVVARLSGNMPSGMSMRAGLMAAAAMMLGEACRSQLGMAYVDLLSALMGWAALLAMLKFVDEGSLRWSVWAGVFCGLAIGVKWTSGVAAIAVFLGIFFARGIRKPAWKQVLLAGAAVILTVLPWLAKNVTVTGSPLYPYFLPTEGVSAQRLEAANASDTEITLAQALLFPLTSTAFGFNGAAGFGSDLGPLLALLAIPGLWALRRQPAGRIIALGLGLCWLVILAGSQTANHLQQTRLYFALLPWAGIAAGAGWQWFSSLRFPQLRVERLLSVLLLLGIVFTTVEELGNFSKLKSLGTVLGVEDEQEYLSDALGWHYRAVDGLYDLPAGSKTLMLWEARGWYAPSNTSADVWIDRWRADYWNYGSSERILDAWKAQGFTHMLIWVSGSDWSRGEEDTLEPQGWAELDRMTSMLPVVQTFGDAYILYALP